jgi:hypothetical protein
MVCMANQFVIPNPLTLSYYIDTSNPRQILILTSLTNPILTNVKVISTISTINNSHALVTSIQTLYLNIIKNYVKVYTV